MIADAECIGHNGQRGIHGGARWEEAAIYDIEIIEVVCFAVHVESGCFLVGAESDCSVLVGYASERNTLTDVKITAKEPMMAVAAVDRATIVLQGLLKMSLELVMSLLIVGCVAQNDLSVTIESHAIVGIG
jgi:hypothetical protein